MKWARLLAYIIGCTRPQAARQILRNAGAVHA
jgi:hypothetical protein